MGNFYELFPLKQEKIYSEDERIKKTNCSVRITLHGFSQKYYFQLRNG